MTMGLMNRMASLSIHGKTVANTSGRIFSVMSGGSSSRGWSRSNSGSNMITDQVRTASATTTASTMMIRYNTTTIPTRQCPAVNTPLTFITPKQPYVYSSFSLLPSLNTLSPISRCQSTKAAAAAVSDKETTNSISTVSDPSLLDNDYDNYHDDDGTIIATGPDGTKYAIPTKPLGHYVQRRHAPKIPPHIVQSRISKLRSIAGSSKNIRHSPWRLNLICQFAQGQTVEDALIQLKFVHKVKAPLIYSLIQGTANSAKTKYGLLPSQLEVVECFATQGTHLKRIKMMGRGRAGKMHRRFSHARVVLREIDFPLKIMQCTSLNQRNKWVSRMEAALEDQAEYWKEKEELDALEKEAQEVRKKKEEASLKK